jgi:hypothetical protein
MTKKKKSKKEKKLEMTKNLLEEIKKMQLDDDELGQIQAGGQSKKKNTPPCPKCLVVVKWGLSNVISLRVTEAPLLYVGG